MSLISDANSSVNLVKAALDAKAALSTAEDKEKLAEAKMALADLKDFIADLKEENRALKEHLQIKDELKLEEGHVWLYKINDDDPSRRYCQVCYYDKGKVIPLDQASGGEWHTGERYCPVCHRYRK